MAKNNISTKSGRKPLVDEEVDLIFRKLEPYLKKGLSLNKACLEAQIPKSTAYDLYREYDEFAERIDACKNYHSLLVGDVFTRELERIVEKQNQGENLSVSDVKFVQWVALNGKATKDEYGRKDIPIMSEEEREKENWKLGLRF